MPKLKSDDLKKAIERSKRKAQSLGNVEEVNLVRKDIMSKHKSYTIDYSALEASVRNNLETKVAENMTKYLKSNWVKLEASDEIEDEYEDEYEEDELLDIDEIYKKNIEYKKPNTKSEYQESYDHLRQMATDIKCFIEDNFPENSDSNKAIDSIDEAVEHIFWSVVDSRSR